MESRRKRSRSQLLKWGCYVLALFVCAALQTTPGLFQLGQAKPLLVLPLCLAVAVFEGEFAGALLGTVGGVLLRLLGLLGLRRRLVLVEGGAEARLRDFRDDVLRLGLLLVIGDGQDAGGEVHVAALHPRQTAGHPLHRGAARRAVHPRDVVFFLAHGKIPFPSRPSFF